MASKQIILNRAENQVRQQLFGSVMFAVLGLMLAVTFGNLKVKAATNNVNITFNVNAGAFTLVSGTTDIAWPNVAYGTVNAAHLANNKMDNLVVTDHRGTSTAWTLAATSNGLNASGNVITNNKINFHVANGNVTNTEGSSSNVTKGSNGLLNASLTVMSGDTGATGIYQYDNGPLTLNVLGTELAGDYTGTITLTLT